VYSVVDTAKGSPPVTPYINDIADMIQPGSWVLLLGLGGGGLPYEIRSREVDIHLVAVDVDPDALVTARRVVPDGGDWTYVVSSAREFVAGAAPGSYDMIINDVYMGARMPSEALTHTFMEGEFSSMVRFLLSRVYASSFCSILHPPFPFF
jgi:spermidine synthase